MSFFNCVQAMFWKSQVDKYCCTWECEADNSWDVMIVCQLHSIVRSAQVHPLTDWWVWHCPRSSSLSIIILPRSEEFLWPGDSGVVRVGPPGMSDQCPCAHTDLYHLGTSHVQWSVSDDQDIVWMLCQHIVSGHQCSGHRSCWANVPGVTNSDQTHH